ncbi:MAG: rhomboid family intramembrane serine protease [Desulfobacterales bacterium]|nr:rhomboid family intramembrane serine protease [Desulfobacterales bacterium]MDD4072617.1 rhomboid family intramembrane serine protease [Desulfobacterales bacterium]MDD4393986.1 rhomboid family intramembrane serine protease [Desulfobacterales bacterium]
MAPYRTGTSFGFGSNLTRLGKRLLIIYSVIYVLELLFENWLKIPIAALLQIYPASSDSFHIWQIFTHPFIHNPHAPIGFVINCIVFYFFAAPVEKAFGSIRFLILFYFSAFGGALCGLAFSSVSGFNAPFMGMLPGLLSLIVVFGLLNTEATILLMFILPIKAKYLSYGTALMTLLTFLAKANPYGPYHLGGILCGYIYFKGPKTLFDPNLIYLKYLQWQLKKKRSKFRVISNDDKKDDDKRTYH